MVASRLGGMTVAELDHRITPAELAMWAGLLKVEHEEHAEAMRKRR